MRHARAKIIVFAVVGIAAAYGAVWSHQRAQLLEEIQRKGAEISTEVIESSVSQSKRGPLLRARIRYVIGGKDILKDVTLPFSQQRPESVSIKVLPDHPTVVWHSGKSIEETRVLGYFCLVMAVAFGGIAVPAMISQNRKPQLG